LFQGRELESCHGFVRNRRHPWVLKFSRPNWLQSRRGGSIARKNPAAETRLKLKADLGRYLSKVATLDASSGLTIDGLRYLKLFEKSQSEKRKKGQSPSL
jgi:hypothetical protein